MKWAHPDGIERAQILFRARYDADLDGTYVDEPWIVLYALNTPAVPGGTRDEAVRVTEVTRTSVTIEVDVQLALESMRLVYVEMGVL
jgi:hypothetical protein